MGGPRLRMPRVKDFAGSHLDALAFVWSENFHRRHLNPSQVAVAEAKRVKASQEYANEVNKMKAEAQEKMKEAGKKGGRGKKKKPVEQIPQGSSGPAETTSARLTSSRRAKAAGTNRIYLETAETLLETDPKRLEDVESGTGEEERGRSPGEGKGERRW